MTKEYLTTRLIPYILFLLYPTCVYSAPFENCPTEAFLVQESVAKLYGVNLATGYYEELSDSMGTSGKLNAMGFNVYDDYLYAFSNEYQDIVKIHNNYQVEPLNVTGMPSTTFYVGDVSINENIYYAYRRGWGIYAVNLDPNASDYLAMTLVANDNNLNLNIYDFSFNPLDGLIYAVDRNGVLYQVDHQQGEATSLGNVGQSGTFGAGYFDASGKLYISRNQDGHIYRIDVSGGDLSAEFFAFGPLSSNNDGARCGLAPIIDEESTVDFGDAPETYGSSIESNGARHEQSDEYVLGSALGNDDGVDFVTGFESGLNTLVNVEAKGGGYLNTWVDWDQSGSFDPDEQAIQNYRTEEGDNRILLDVPVGALAGNTWARVRYSSIADLPVNGGASDGEVEDYQILVTDSGISVVSYPSSNSYVTLAYEDNWPQIGDYDMNDVVMAYRTRRYITPDNEVVRYDIEGKLMAIGASYHNGFAVLLDNIPTSNIDEYLSRFEINGLAQVQSPLEQNDVDDDAVIVVSEDLWDEVSASAGCQFYRTQKNCTQEQAFSYQISIPLKNPVPVDQAPKDVLNPFIFATPGTYHGDIFTSQPGRSLEIHLKNKPVSAKFDTNFWGLANDDSNAQEGSTFITENNLPWAIETPVLWDHPLERTDISKAYSQFVDFVRTDGQANKTWYTRSNGVLQNLILNQ